MEPHVVIDANVHGAKDRLEPHARVTALPGETIDRAALRTADALVVRTVTSIDRDLLAGTPVRFVGTATAGTDHVQRGDLEDLGIAFAHAPGCNARAVAEYVVAATLLAERRLGRVHPRMGVVGLGNVGSRVVALLQVLGREVHGVDPAVDGSEVGLDVEHRRLESLLEACDAVTVHVPLTRAGPHPTVGLVDATALAAGPSLFINTSRGGVLDDEALLRTPNVRAVLDVFCDEPRPSEALLNPDGPVVVATPHIAGYSRQAKSRATEMVLAPLASHFGLNIRKDERGAASVRLAAATVEAAVSLACPLQPVEQRLRGIRDAQQFRHVRRTYSLREEFARHHVQGIDDPGLAAALGFRVGPATALT